LRLGRRQRKRLKEEVEVREEAEKEAKEEVEVREEAEKEAKEEVKKEPK
jgi:hypothetical protein